MYAQAQALSAYHSQRQKETLSPRDIEKRVFQQVTGRLEKSMEDTQDPLKLNLNQALSDNLLLWNALAADVATEENPFPSQLKAQIFYLSQFMSHQTKLIRQEDDRTKIQAMIDINRMMIEGLSKTVPQNSDVSENFEIGA